VSYEKIFWYTDLWLKKEIVPILASLCASLPQLNGIDVQQAAIQYTHKAEVRYQTLGPVDQALITSF
jgi:hypothetical protein